MRVAQLQNLLPSTLLVALNITTSATRGEQSHVALDRESDSRGRLDEGAGVPVGLVKGPLGS